MVRPELISGPSAFGRNVDFNDRYLWWLGFCLAGYAFLGKGFAYVGVYPLLIGELMLLVGMIAVFRSGCGFAALATFPTVALVSLIGLVSYQALIDLREHGLDAIRDSVVVVYGVYAFIVIAILLQRPERLNWIIAAYAKFALAYGAFVGVFTNSPKPRLLGDYLPRWPNGTGIIDLRLGEAGVHLAGVAVFVLLGFCRVPKWWLALLIVSIILLLPSRGGTLSCVLPLAMAIVIAGKVRSFLPVAAVCSAVFFVSLVTGWGLTVDAGDDDGARSVSAQQLIESVSSLTSSSQYANLDGTKEFRLNWWTTIIDYTVYGPYFWTGKGYGFSLAESDGFVVGTEFGGPVVRSPHNAHMTILARSGVPGLVLWSAVCLSWFAMMFHTMFLARKRGDTSWSDFHLWLICYASAVIIDSTFDVALEGPMIGIPFWCIYGCGVATMMIYHAESRAGRRSELRQAFTKASAPIGSLQKGS